MNTFNILGRHIDCGTGSLPYLNRISSRLKPGTIIFEENLTGEKSCLNELL